MPKIVLADFQADVEKKHSDFEVTLPGGEVVAFRNALRLPKERRLALADAMNLPERAKNDNGDDLYDVYKDSFRISEKTPGDYDKLAAVIGDDPATWMELFVAFQEDMQSGEASPSEG